MTALAAGELEDAASMAAALHAGDVTVTELVERALERAERWQPVTNAFSQLWPGEALVAAAAALPGDGGSAGIPVAIKDLFDVAGHETTGCSAAYAGRVAANDAAVVASIRAGGLVGIGKTNQHELAAGGTNLVSACGRTCNPYDPRRITGGSSGGSAAAVAAGVVPWALGSDTGGSIRIPSSLCGTFGLKPTTGKLPLDGVMPLAPSLDCPGPIAASARDLATLYHLMGGEPTPRLDPTSLRLALVRPFLGDLMTVAVEGAIDGVGRAFEAAGAAVDIVDGSGVDDAPDVWSVVAWPEFARAYPDVDVDLLLPRTRSFLGFGRRVTAEQQRDAAARRREIAEWFDGALRDHDLLVLPTTPYAAPLADEDDVDLGRGRMSNVTRGGTAWFTRIVNLARVPAVNLPAGEDRGLPVGVTLVAGRGADPVVLGAALLWEEATGYTHRVPEPAA